MADPDLPRLTEDFEKYCPFCKQQTLVFVWQKSDPHGYPMEDIYECSNQNCGNEWRQPVT